MVLHKALAFFNDLWMFSILVDIDSINPLFGYSSTQTWQGKLKKGDDVLVFKVFWQMVLKVSFLLNWKGCMTSEWLSVQAMVLWWQYLNGCHICYKCFSGLFSNTLFKCLIYFSSDFCWYVLLTKIYLTF